MDVFRDGLSEFVGEAKVCCFSPDDITNAPPESRDGFGVCQCVVYVGHATKVETCITTRLKDQPTILSHSHLIPVPSAFLLADQCTPILHCTSLTGIDSRMLLSIINKFYT
jgi:hypothetical protein